MESFREKYNLCGMIYGNTSACTGLLSRFSEGLADAPKPGGDWEFSQLQKQPRALLSLVCRKIAVFRIQN